jgi:hypothetical protein
MNHLGLRGWSSYTVDYCFSVLTVKITKGSCVASVTLVKTALLKKISSYRY